MALRILALSTSFPRWQADVEGNFVYELSRRLAAAMNVYVLAPHARGALQDEMLEGMQVHRFRYAPSFLEVLCYEGGILPGIRQHPWRVALVPMFLIALLVATIRSVRANDIEVIHAHWLFPLGFVAVVCKTMMRGRKLRVVCTSHGGDLYGLRGPIWTVLLRWTATRCDEVAVVSSAMQVAARDRGIRSDTRCMPMGVDARRRFVPGDESLRRTDELLFVGRLVDKKGVLHLVRAFGSLVKMFPELKLTLVGAGPEKARLVLQAEELGVGQRVRFEGSVSQAALPQYYRRATMFVGPSVVTAYGDQEGLGLVFAEAAACECPVVASNLDAIKDVVKDGETGLTFHASNEGDLAEKVARLLESPETRRVMGLAGRAHVLRTFDWQEVSKHYAALLSGTPPA